MHQYLTAIGFGGIKGKKTLDNILRQVEIDFTQHDVISDDEDTDYCEFRKDFAENMGISVVGNIDTEEYFQREFYSPYFVGSSVSTYAEVLVDRRIDREAYVGVCEDAKIGISIIFHLINAAEYEKKSMGKDLTEELVSATLSGLCNEGVILLPLLKDEKQQKQQERELENRSMLISAAKSGDPVAIESLTLDDIDTYSKVSRRLVTEDVFSIVDTYIMPYGIECDQYSILGTIKDVRIVTNEMTEEEIYVLGLEVNNLALDICVPARNLIGEPAEGRRFKGNIWMQGKVNLD